MTEQMSLQEYKLAYKQQRLEEERRGFYIHLIVYVAVNALLIGINLYFVPGVLWFFFPLVGWGICVAAHYLGAVRWAARNLERKEAEAEYKTKYGGKV